MLIDGAVHLWTLDHRFPWNPIDGVECPDFDAPFERLTEEMTAAGFTGAIAVQPRVYGYEHSYLAHAVERHPSQVAGIGLIDPESKTAPDSLAELIGDLGLRGVRLIPLASEDPHWLSGPSGDAIFAEAERLEVPVSILTVPSQLPAIAERAGRNPNSLIVIDHLGLVPPGDLEGRSALTACAAHPNVYVRISALPAISLLEGDEPQDIGPLVTAALESFGPDRVIFGTDWPYALEHGSWESSLEMLKASLGLTPDAAPGLFGANAAKLWGLK